MKKASLLVVIGLVLLTGGLTYAVFNHLNQLGSDGPKLKFGIKPADLPNAEITPTPKKTSTDNLWRLGLDNSSVTTTPTPTPSVAAENSTLANENETNTDTTLASRKTASTTSRVCTPVYGMADTCVEHITVDTGAETEAFFSLSALSYLGGLISFVKAKKAKK